MKYLRPLVIWILVIVVIYFAAKYITETSAFDYELKYSEFWSKVEKKEIKSVTIGRNELKGELKEGNKKFRTYLPDNDLELLAFLRKNGVLIKAEAPAQTPIWVTLMWILPYLILFGFFYIIFKQAQAGGSQALSFGKSKARLFTEDRPKVTFKDVAGVNEAIEELSEIVEFLKNPRRFQNLGARIPKGVLLLGPPGAGKTLLGKAIAGEADVPFFYISGSDFVEMFVGVGASRVRDLFEQAKRNSPCIIFMDEIDAVGRQRGAGLGGGHDEREQTLNQLLIEMDGFESNVNVILLAATNRPDILDPALLRPGRFDRQVIVDKADINGRKAILEVHRIGKPLAKDVDFDVLARRTPGFSGADLENLLNEAAILAARANRDEITMADCEEAIDRVMVGPERKSRIISDREKKITSYHEAGHAILSLLLPHSDPIRKVTILPRGMALGITWHLPLEDRHLYTKNELLANIAGLLGGRVAEEVVFEEVTTGSENDLEKATSIARSMICEYGMSENLGPITYGKQHRQVFLGRDIMEDRNYSEETAKQIDMEVRALIEERYELTVKTLRDNIETLHKVAERLLEKEVIDGDELKEIVDKYKKE